MFTPEGPLALTLPNERMATTRRIAHGFVKKMATQFFGLKPSMFGMDKQQTVQQVADVLKRGGLDLVSSVFRRPQVHALLVVANQAIGAGNLAWGRELLRLLLAQLLFELSVDNEIDGAGIQWDGPLPVKVLGSPTHALSCDLPAGYTETLFQSGRMVFRAKQGPEVEVRPSAGESYRPLGRRVSLALVDSNPISDFEAHPDKAGNQLSLGEATPETWCESLVAAFELIEKHMPVLRSEMDLTLQQVIPVGTDSDKHLSASYMESVGTIYMTLHPNLMTMTEAVIHEYQHNKLHMLFHLDRVMENAHKPLFSSPVRPDPRPLKGILLAAHAFVPVAELYKRLTVSEDLERTRAGFDGRFLQIVENNSEALDVLRRNAIGTPVGAQLIAELVELNQDHRTFVGLENNLSAPAQTARIFTGFACNNSCRFCNQATAREHASTEPDLLALVAEAVGEGASRLTFCGGEAVLRLDDLAAAVAEARRMGINEVGVFTNGRMLAYSRLTQSLVEAGAIHFDISLHGATPHSHDWVTQSPGSQQQTLKGIRNVSRHGAVTHIHTVVLRSNYRELARIASQAARLGAEAVHFRFPTPEGAVLTGDQLPSLLPRFNVVKRYLEEAWDVATRAGLHVVLHDFPLCVLGRMAAGGAVESTRWFGVPEGAWERGTALFPPECQGCTEKSLCYGPSKQYVDYYGDDEFTAFT